MTAPQSTERYCRFCDTLLVRRFDEGKSPFGHRWYCDRSHRTKAQYYRDRARDPEYTTQTRAERRIENVTWLLEQGVSRNTIAEREGVSIDSLARFFHRHGLHDLACRFERLYDDRRNAA